MDPNSADHAPLPTSGAASAAPGQPAPRKKVSPTLAGLGFMVLFMLFYFVSQLIIGGGPQVQWVRDFEEAQKSAKSLNRRIFLLMHDPNCPITRDMDRSVFPQRWARDILAQMVACRVELKENDPLRRTFKVKESPTSIVLEADGKPVREAHTGGYDELQFRTYVHPK